MINFDVKQLLGMAINHPKITHALVKGVSEAAIKNTQKHGIGNTMKKAGRIAKVIGTGAKVANGVKNAAVATGHGIATAGRAVGNAAVTTGRAIGTAAKATGKFLGNTAIDAWYGGGDTAAKTALRATTINPLTETFQGIKGTLRGAWQGFKDHGLTGVLTGGLSGGINSARYQAKYNHLLHALKNRFGETYSPEQLKEIARREVTQLADDRGVSQVPGWMMKRRKNAATMTQGYNDMYVNQQAMYGNQAFSYIPRHFSYGVQVASNAIKGLKLGAGAGTAAGLVGYGSRGLNAKQAALIAGGSSLLGAGVGAAKGAIEEHRRHKKLRKAGMHVNHKGIATIKDKDGKEYEVAIQGKDAPINTGAYLRDAGLPEYGKSLRKRLDYYKKTKVDLPKGIDKDDLMIIKPDDADYDAEALKGVILHEAGHKHTRDTLTSNNAKIADLRRGEEAMADKYAVEHGADPKAMLNLLERDTRKRYSKDPRFLKLPREVQDKIIKRSIQDYRGDYLHKVNGRE